MMAECMKRENGLNANRITNESPIKSGLVEFGG